jgi:hypothetical protein
MKRIVTSNNQEKEQKIQIRRIGICFGFNRERYIFFFLKKKKKKKEKGTQPYILVHCCKRWKERGLMLPTRLLWLQ